MRYEDAINYIHDTYKFGSKLGLDNIRELLNRLGNPQNSFKTIHVAGTNGKGSVTAMLSSILLESGYKVASFTSPYLEDFTERIKINLKKIPKEELTKITMLVKDKITSMVEDGHSHPTEFEVVTAIGLTYFAQESVDIAVIEVGLGGRLDATNVIEKPLLSIITQISFDHIDILGNSLSEIAYEKAGIIKKNCPVVNAVQKKEAEIIIKRLAHENNADLIQVQDSQISKEFLSLEVTSFDFNYKNILYKDLKLPLLGEHQIYNASIALTAIEVLKELGYRIDKDSIYNGMAKVSWPGRLELISKKYSFLLDGAHNEGGARALSHVLKSIFNNFSITLIIGVLGDKDVDIILDRLCPLADNIIVTKANNPRAIDINKLFAKAKKCSNNVDKEENVVLAIKKSIREAREDSLILICGSLYLVGEARTYLREINYVND